MNINNQFKSVIEWQFPEENEIFIKASESYEEIKNASKLILQPGQGCIITYEGKVEAVLDSEGIYDLKTGNHPFLTKLKNLFKLQERSEHIMAIWFYRKADILNMRWGTRVPIAYTDPVYTFPILLSAFGNYSIRITKPLYFFENVIAGQDAYCHYDLKELFISRISQPMTDYLANAKFSYVDIDSNLNNIAQEAQEKTRSIFTDLGFEVLDFRIEGTQFDKDTLDRIAEVSDIQSEVKSAQIAGVDFAELQKLKAMRDAAKNPGAAGTAMGMVTGMQLSNTANEAPKETVKQKLEQLKELFDSELISQEEYDQKRKDILASM